MIDKDKIYRTRNDYRTAAEIIAEPWVRIYATDGDGEYPVHGATFSEGRWRIEQWSIDGTYVIDGARTCDCDLIEVTEPIELWAIVRNSDNYVFHQFKTESEAVSRFVEGNPDFRIVRLREVQE